MPELPEVETVCRGLRPHLTNKTIGTVETYHSTLRLPIQKNLTSLLEKKQIHSLRRQAKYLIFELSHGFIVSHLGMSGCFRYHLNKKPKQKHDHIILTLDDGSQLHYNDPRRFGLFLYYEQDPPSFLTTLGIEPLSTRFNADFLSKILAKRKTPIKPCLMDNKIVVGVGNIYAQESLFLSQISPLRLANSLSKKEISRLVKAIKTTLSNAIEQGGTTLKDFSNPSGQPGYFTQKLNVYGRKNEPCVDCKTPIKSISQSGRTSSFCPNCQK